MAEEAPEAIHAKVESAFNAGDLEGLVALYETDALMVTPEGDATGLDAIRGNWERLLALEATMTLSTSYAIRNGDLALLRNDYLVSGPGLEFRGSTTEVARLQGDGSWRYVIDHPFGANSRDE